jgi:RNA polymerase sigma factor (sigma-70 family)
MTLQTLLRAARRAAGPPADGPADGELLDRFVARQDEAAFALLLHRHGPWLLGLCRRLLPDAHAAEDAFQATFLVLVRRAGAVRRRASVGSWLHGVALRVAARSRSRQAREQQMADGFAPRPVPDPADEAAAREAARLLHAEIARLPRRYREPILLCDLAGLSREAAARRLGCGPGAVKGRLERGRAALRDRLTRRGLVLAAGVTLAGSDIAPAAVPAALRETLLGAARAVALGAGVEVITPAVVRLMEGVTTVTGMHTWKALAAVVVFGVSAVAVGFGAAPAPKPARPLRPVTAALPAVLPFAPAAPVPPPDNRAAKAALGEAARALEDATDQPMERARLWFEVARLHAKLDDRPAAEAALGKARQVIDTMGDPKYWEWRGLGQGYANLGDVKQVLALTAAVPDTIPNYRGTGDGFRQTMLQEAAVAAAEAGHMAAGLQIADAITKPETKQWVQAAVRRKAVLNRAKAGDVAGAVKLVGDLPTALMKAQALVGTVYLNQTFADMLDGDSGVALFQIDASDRDGARRSVREALDLAAHESESRRAQLTAAAVRALAKLGDTDAAQKELPNISNPALRLKAEVYIAMAQVRAGQEKAALELVARLKSDDERVYALHQIGYAQAVAGNKVGAKGNFRRAVELDQHAKAHGHNIASAQAAAGDIAGAIQTIESQKSDVTWSNIIASQAKAGDFTGALENARRHAESRWWRAECLLFIGLEQTRHGQEGAARVWIAREDDTLSKAYALVGLAEGLYRENGRAKRPADE